PGVRIALTREVIGCARPNHALTCLVTTAGARSRDRARDWDPGVRIAPPCEVRSDPDQMDDIRSLNPLKQASEATDVPDRNVPSRGTPRRRTADPRRLDVCGAITDSGGSGGGAMAVAGGGIRPAAARARLRPKELGIGMFTCAGLPNCGIKAPPP